MTTTQMEVAIAKWWDPRKHLIVPNISWGLLSYEADMLIVRPTGYCIEVEIKRSYKDYKDDFKKRKWKVRPNNGQGKLIKEFYYAFPIELWEKRMDDIVELLPDFAGVLTCHKDRGMLYTQLQRSATPNRMARPLRNDEMFQLARLGTLRIWSLKRTILKLL
jgi:hypothetical protein